MSEASQKSTSSYSPLSENTLFNILTRVGLSLNKPVMRSAVQAGVSATDDDPGDPLQDLIASAKHAGISLRETKLQTANEAIGFVREAIPIILASDDGKFVVLDKIAGGHIEGSVVDERILPHSMTRRELGKQLSADPPPRCFVCILELQCDLISAASDYPKQGHGHCGHGHGGQGHGHAQQTDHPSPLRRFLGLLSLDRRDISTVILFALVAGILALATPLAIESLVNVVSWGTYLQPLILLGVILLACLGLSGLLKVLQTVVVEIIQRRQFVRIVSDLSHRFARANQAALIGVYPREFANRIFDIMTIQKATAILLLDGVTIVLTTFLGLVLLAFYHPFLLGFDVVLVLAMVSIIWVLGYGGIDTAVDESMTKYRVAHWLQDVISSPAAFKIGGGESLAVERANQLTADYINAREDQFHVVFRQIVFAVSLQVVASSVLLALGGWLVISGELTLGQLVASELVVTTVVGAFAKAGKSFEIFYDLMAGIDKVGHLLDIPADPRQVVSDGKIGAAEIQWGDLTFHDHTSHSKIRSARIEAGSRVAIIGNDVSGRAAFARTLAGLTTPSSGLVQVDGFDAANASANGAGRVIGYAGANDLFHGTLCENLDLGRAGIGQDQVRQALQKVGLAEDVLKLPGGLQTWLQTRGYPLNDIQSRQLALARAMLASPRLLVVDGLLDDLSADDRKHVWQSLASSGAPWTLVVNTNRDDVAALCDSQIAVHKS